MENDKARLANLKEENLDIGKNIINKEKKLR